jgi:hypothetical protein
VRANVDRRSPVTLSTYRFAADKLAKFIGGVRVGEASTARLDAAFAVHARRPRIHDIQTIEDDLARRAPTRRHG